MLITSDKTERRPLDLLLLSLGISLVYYGAGRLGWYVTPSKCWVSPMWAPSGIGMAVVLIYGMRAFPGIFLGLLLITLHYSASAFFGSVHILGSIFESFIGAFLLRRFGKGEFRFKQSNEILAFFGIAVILTPLLSTVIELGAMSLMGNMRVKNIPLHLLRFFLGNGLGVLIFTPMILSGLELVKNWDRDRIRGFEVTALLLGICYASYFSYRHDRKFIIYPFSIWAALRFGHLGVSLCAMIVSIYGILKLHQGFEQIEMLWTQIFLATCTLTGYLLASIHTAREQVIEKEQESTHNLLQWEMAEEALEVLDQAIQKAPMGFALVSSDFKLIRVNEFMAEITGYPVGYLAGKAFRDITPSIASFAEEAVSRVFQNEQAMLSIPVRVVSSGGEQKVHYGNVSYYPVRLPGSRELFGVAIVFNDMTEQHRMGKKLRENQRWLNFAQDVGKMGVFEFIFQNMEVRWNAQLESIYGLGPGEYQGTLSSWISFIHPEDIEAIRKEVKHSIGESSEFSVQFRIIRKDQKVRWILCRGGAMRNKAGRVTGISGINVDITDQKDIEDRLRKAEVDLRSALEIRDEFFAIASHELKTPLTSLKLQLQLHERAVQSKPSEALTKQKVEQLLQRNLRQTERLARLVDDMLDISRMKTGKLTLKREVCEINQILRDIIARYRENFLASGSGEPMVEMGDVAFGNWDHMRIEQVFANVINNAIRYGLGKPIRISVQNLGDVVRISVEDQGQGIPEKDRERIFDRFERGRGNRETSGLGLGLFISRQIAEAHGGRIWVEGKERQGSVFHIELPVITSLIAAGSSSEEVIG